MSPRSPHVILGLFALSACSRGGPAAGVADPRGGLPADAASDVTSSDSLETASDVMPGAVGDRAPDDDAVPESPWAGAPASDSPPGGPVVDRSVIGDSPVDAVSQGEAGGPDADGDAGPRDATLTELPQNAGDAAAPVDASPESSTSVADAAGDAPAEGSSADASVQTEATANADDAAEPMDGGDSPPVAAPVVPTLRGGHYVLASGPISFEVDPAVGGRIVSFALDGQNVLAEAGASANNYGSTFWTSPQSDWGWPPPPEIDNLPYRASIDGGALSLQGMASAALGVAVTKTFAFDAARGAITIAYTVENVGPTARSLAPWEVTRVRYGGLVLFPAGPPTFSADSGPPVPTQEASGATWFDAGPAPPGASAKLFADVPRGWIAQEVGGLLFVKKFPAIVRGLDAPGEAAIEVYVSGDRAYIEIEDQGAFGPIAAGASRTWHAAWFLAKLPPGEDGGLGSASLVAAIDAL